MLDINLVLFGVNPRAYTKTFGFNLVYATAYHKPILTLRQKRSVDPRSTDVRVFSELALGDTWPDANLIPVYKYLRHSVSVPDTWCQTIADLDSELSSLGLL